MKTLKIFIPLIILGVSGCSHRLAQSTVDLLPPNKDSRSSDESSRRWSELAKAILAEPSEKSCSSLIQLSSDAYFPLRDWAKINWLLLCEKNTETVRAQLQQFSTQEKQLWSLEIQSLLKKHWQNLTQTEQVEALWQQALESKNIIEKEDLLKKALELAQSNESLQKEAQRRLFQNSPRLTLAGKKTNLTPQEHAQVVADYRRHMMYQQAIDLEKKFLKSQKSILQKWTSYKNLRVIAKSAQKNDESLTYAKQWVEFSYKNIKHLDLGKVSEAATTVARALWTDSQHQKATEVLLQLEQVLAKQQSSLEEVYFLLAKINEDLGKLKEAEEFFIKAQQALPGPQTLRDRRLWNFAWFLYKQNRALEAEKIFLDLAETALEPGDRNRALFWAARVEKDTEQKKVILQRIKDQDPIGFYGLMARRELQESFSPLTVDQAHEKNLIAMKTGLTQDKIRAEWMIHLSLRSAAEVLLKKFDQDLNSQKTAKSFEADRLILASAFSRAGIYLPLFSLYTSLDTETKNSFFTKHPEWLFPLPWLDSIKSSAQKAGIPAELLLAITRQESAFDPNARSRADALGLTQLLPNVAQQIAKQNQIAYTKANDLFNPEISLKLGAYELKSLLKRWDDRLIPAVSSYNASEFAVRRWLQTKSKTDPLEFIEEIPYEETRIYVRLVIRNMIFYRRLIESEPFIFPESYLKL